MFEAKWRFAAALVAGLASVAANADVWDTASNSDDSFDSTGNRLVHGVVQVHDLGARPGPAADVDWYFVAVPARSSYEVVIDGWTGDIANGLIVQRWSETATQLLQTGQEPSLSPLARRIAWVNDTGSTVVSLLRVFGASCGSSCTSADQYTIRARETTVNLARFNNAGTQVTVLLSQNASDVTASANVYFWSTSGVLLSNVSLVNFPPKTMSVMQTSTFVSGASGHITVAHTAPYGTWNVKAVALEPATGFSFDTPGVVRP